VSAPRLEIVIDELRLLGVSQADAPAVARALQERLGELGAAWSAAGTAPPPARDEASRRAPATHVASAEPSALGGAVADSVFGAVTGGRR
jgi:hypothetical protein